MISISSIKRSQHRTASISWIKELIERIKTNSLKRLWPAQCASTWWLIPRTAYSATRLCAAHVNAKWAAAVPSAGTMASRKGTSSSANSSIKSSSVVQTRSSMGMPMESAKPSSSLERWRFTCKPNAQCALSTVVVSPQSVTFQTSPAISRTMRHFVLKLLSVIRIRCCSVLQPVKSVSRNNLKINNTTLSQAITAINKLSNKGNYCNSLKDSNSKLQQTKMQPDKFSISKGLAGQQLHSRRWSSSSSRSSNCRLASP